MRLREVFSIYRRKLPSGKTVFYFETCAYLKRKAARRKTSRSYADISKHRTEKHLVPYFARMRLDKITTVEIEDWLTSLSGKGLKNISINGYLIVLKVMLGEAARRKIIKTNPCMEVGKLMEEKKNVEILTPDEVRGLFPSDWADVWGGFLFYLFNKLAACTGMRLGEVVGLRGEFVFDNYINVCGQWTRYGYGDTKTHKERNIPIPALIRFELQKLMDINGRGYLFSENGGERPIERRQVQEGLFIAHGAARRVETVPA